MNRAASRDPSEQFMGTRAAVIVLISVWLVLCWPWLIAGRTVPWDSKDQFYPALSFVAQSLRAGDFSLWNPYIYGGYPTVSDPQAMIFLAACARPDAAG